MNPKQRAAEAAIAHLRSNMTVGLGTGSTADFFLQALAAAMSSGALRGIRGVATSRQSEWRAQQLSIPLMELGTNNPDVTIDGADEVAPNLDLIKGLGGALLREKMVAQASKKLIIIADASKRVSILGSKSPVPVEVTPFGHESHMAFFAALGAAAVLRRSADGSIFISDNANYIYDCRFTSIANPIELEEKLRGRAGVVCTGLFLGMASLAIIADDQGIHELKR
jgi:ribose 5-phosphate isomerase A